MISKQLRMILTLIIVFLCLIVLGVATYYGGPTIDKSQSHPDGNNKRNILKTIKSLDSRQQSIEIIKY
ncbi:hypothetical protein CN601_01605 [Bacillus sp. AFS017336]|nr:hypothetical protein CN601_01605 [Bacillus sp. AFS017336]